MILAVDIGNTTIHFCSIEKRGVDLRVLHSRKYPTDGVSFPYFRDCSVDPQVYQGAVLCSVVPEKTKTLTRMVENELKKRVLVVSSDLDCGLEICVKKPEKLGADRLADACGASVCVAAPFITVDIGTAITINAVNEKLQFIGGAIAPGLDTAMQSLENRTAQLFSEILVTPDHAIGTNTEECLQSGVVFGSAFLIEGLVKQMEKEIGTPAALILTGGGSAFLDPLIQREHVTDPDLLMRGLAEIYNRNSQR